MKGSASVLLPKLASTYFFLFRQHQLTMPLSISSGLPDNFLCSPQRRHPSAVECALQSTHDWVNSHWPYGYGDSPPVTVIVFSKSREFAQRHVRVL